MLRALCAGSANVTRVRWTASRIDTRAAKKAAGIGEGCGVSYRTRVCTHPHSPLLTTFRSLARPRDAPPTMESSLLLRFVLISMLLHALVLLVFGTAAGGRGARSGDSSWGGLDVTLRRLSPEPGSGIKLAPGDETTSPGAAILRRLGSTPAAPSASPLEKAPAAPRPEPAAPSIQPQPPPDVTPVEPAPPQADVARPQETPPPAPSPSFEALPPLNRSAPEEIDQPTAPAATSPPPKVERAPAPVVPKPRERPAAPPPPVAPQPIEREIAPSLEPPLREVPAPPAPQPVEPVAPPKLDREIAPAIEPREKAKAAPVPQPVERATPPKVESPTAPAVEPPREKPLPAPTPVERIAPAKIEPQMAPPLEAPAPRRAPADTGAPTERAAPPIERATPPAVAPGRAPSTPAPTRIETPGESAPRLRFGAPDPGDEIFKPRGDAVAPAAEPAAAPRLDLEATRQRAREIASDGAAYRGFVPAIPAPPPVDRKAKLADAIDKAQKPDCRDAYAAMGLLAVVPLVASTVGNGGCRW